MSGSTQPGSNSTSSKPSLPTATGVPILPSSSVQTSNSNSQLRSGNSGSGSQVSAHNLSGSHHHPSHGQPSHGMVPHIHNLPPGEHVLITIPGSHYVERARWALDLCGARYREDQWPPIWHWLGTYRAAPGPGAHTVPMLVLPPSPEQHPVIRDSRDILAYVRDRCPALHLYPTDSEQRLQVEQLELQFASRLGVLTRAVLYYYLFQRRDQCLRALATAHHGIPAWRRWAFYLTYPLFKVLCTKGLRISQANAARGLEKVKQIFAEVAVQLNKSGPPAGTGGTAASVTGEGHGQPRQRYLVGNAFSAADLTFSSLAALLILPPEYGAPLIRLEVMPPEFQAIVRELRDTPAGQHVLQMYRKHRHPPLQAKGPQLNVGSGMPGSRL